MNYGLPTNYGTAPEFFSATMSKRRFHTLVQAIRFDDRNSRLERKKTDNLAPIRYNQKKNLIELKEKI
jgi:hypothetical protein